MARRQIVIEIPDWAANVATPGNYVSDEDRMGLAIQLARRNVEARAGGPFGAAVFERGSGKLVGAGVNLVLPMKNSVLHAEVVAIMVAEQERQTFTLGVDTGMEHDLVTSCEPCAMCLGAIHWSGITRLVTGATKADVEAFGFDEGPVFSESYGFLEERGLAVRREVLRAEARAVLELYTRMNGEIY